MSFLIFGCEKTFLRLNCCQKGVQEELLKPRSNYLICPREKIIRKERLVYVITQRGMTVLKYFRELKEALPIVEETGNKAPYPF